MIKTFVNRHDLEYFLFAMVKAFFHDADILPPDTAEHNKPADDVGENQDVIECIINSNRLDIIFKKGIWFKEERYFNYEISSYTNDLGNNSDGSLSIENESDITRYKDEIRGYIYDSLAEYSKKDLPWGNLTGIRPTKLYLQKLKARNSLVNNNSFTSFKEFAKEDIDAVLEEMQRTYRVSPEKNVLGADIAIREDKIINSMHGIDGYSLYIGIPFCPSTCLYCSFTSNPIFSYKDFILKYLDSVCKELEATKELMKGYHLDTIYIGGGTPTTLEANELDILLNKIVTTMPMDEVKEFTVEAGRADSITKEKLLVMKKYPVTRISINPQSMKDETLKLIGRHHSSQDVRDAFSLARELGFDNINMDMILGLPGENVEDVEYTLKEAEKLSPESLTVHSLAIKRASRLKEYMEKNHIERNMNLDEAMDKAIKYAEKMELKPYYLYRQKDMAGNLENTGFAREGKYGLYNILMMEEVQSIVACGAGTVTKRVFADGHIERCDTVKDVHMYVDKIDEMIERKRQLFSV